MGAKDVVIPNFDQYGAAVLIIETRLSKAASASKEILSRLKAKDSGLDEAEEDGFITYNTTIDGDGFDDDDIQDLDLIARVSPGPLDWSVAVFFIYDPKKYRIVFGLPASLPKALKDGTDALGTGVKLLLAKPTGFLRGYYLETAIGLSGGIEQLWVWVYGSLRCEMGRDFVKQALDSALPHANSAVKELPQNAPAAK